MEKCNTGVIVKNYQKKQRLSIKKHSSKIIIMFPVSLLRAREFLKFNYSDNIYTKTLVEKNSIWKCSIVCTFFWKDVISEKKNNRDKKKSFLMLCPSYIQNLPLSNYVDKSIGVYVTRLAVYCAFACLGFGVENWVQGLERFDFCTVRAQSFKSIV